VAERPGNLVAIALKVAVFAIAGLEYSCNFFSYTGLFGNTKFHLVAISFNFQNYAKRQVILEILPLFGYILF
jgi:hypothetical protein